jgi:hypothetical protein
MPDTIGFGIETLQENGFIHRSPNVASLSIAILVRMLPDNVVLSFGS